MLLSLELAAARSWPSLPRKLADTLGRDCLIMPRLRVNREVDVIVPSCECFAIDCSLV